MVDLYSFCGKHIVLIFAYGWDGNSLSGAAGRQAQQDEWRGRNVQFIEVLVPVLQVDEAVDYDALAWLFNHDLYVPNIWQLDITTTVVSADESDHEPGTFLD